MAYNRIPIGKDGPILAALRASFRRVPKGVNAEMLAMLKSLRRGEYRREDATCPVCGRFECEPDCELAALIAKAGG